MHVHQRRVPLHMKAPAERLLMVAVNLPHVHLRVLCLRVYAFARAFAYVRVGTRYARVERALRVYH